MQRCPKLALSIVAGPVWIAFWLARIVPYMLLSGYVNSVGHTWGERPYRNRGTDAAAYAWTSWAPWRIIPRHSMSLPDCCQLEMVAKRSLAAGWRLSGGVKLVVAHQSRTIG